MLDETNNSQMFPNLPAFSYNLFFVAIIYLFINFLILSDCRRGTSQRNGHGQIYRYTKLWKRLIKEETKEALNNFCLM